MKTADKRATKILFETYWSSAGWKKQPQTPAEDFAYAKGAGLMFDRVHLTHDQTIDWALASRKLVAKQKIVDGFLASLSSRRLEFRSGLGSFATLRYFPLHR